MNPVYEQRVAQLKECQRKVVEAECALRERDGLLVVLHQEHGVRQAELARMLTDAAAEVGGSGVSESGVFKAIRRRLGHATGRAPRKHVIP